MRSDLSVRGLTVRYGGLVAIDEVSIAAPAGRITGLIGPNGAGKTSLFNACTGLLGVTQGVIELGDIDVSGAAPARRARLGLGRTFQHIQLVDDLNVFENVALGREARLAGRRFVDQLLSTRRDSDEIASAAAKAIEICDLGDVIHEPVRQLSTGQRRLVELARALAGDFDVLLLDEPSSGLDVAESQRLGEILVETVSSTGTAVLLVEHDMAMVMSICSYIYVLDFGRLIFEGTARQVATNETVHTAYLGMTAA